MLDEIVYLGRDNTIELALHSDGAAITHNTITRLQLYVGATLLDSAVNSALFDLSAADRITLKLGASALTVGRYPATVIVFDATHSNGLVWGTLTLQVK